MTAAARVVRYGWRYGWQKEYVRLISWIDEHGPRAPVPDRPDERSDGASRGDDEEPGADIALAGDDVARLERDLDDPLRDPFEPCGIDAGKPHFDYQVGHIIDNHHYRPPTYPFATSSRAAGATDESAAGAPVVVCWLITGSAWWGRAEARGHISVDLTCRHYASLPWRTTACAALASLTASAADDGAVASVQFIDDDVAQSPEEWRPALVVR